ncbi:hypothetical protein OBBRIDRAFT_829116 [Obba rivulosa]|uniref:F-box domain-containing protein n=1 Tax=Obba rivulosa TaxID=1052685 RepID=A0A8E2AMQ8_9APHY|nr:hypothetical protein OBBRIDRAFT_829116 [Obba rivulosa]
MLQRAITMPTYKKARSGSPQSSRSTRPINNDQTKVRLNLDIYDYIMSFLEPHDLAKMMRTCRTLHSAGTKYLVNHPYPFCRPEILISYCRFVLRDIPRRCPALRAIHLNFRDLHPHSLPSATQAIQLLIWVLSEVPSLQWSRIAIPSLVLDSFPELLLSPYSMRSLRSLTIRDCRMEHAKMIRKLHAPLEELDLCFQSAPSIHSQDIAWLLRRFAGTLRVLTVEGFPFGDEATTIFPHVRKLSVSVCDTSFSIGILYTLFPEVTDVTFVEQDSEMLDITSQLLAQYHFRNGRCPIGSRWSQLQSLTGSVEDLYAMSLACQVDHLIVSFESRGALKFSTVIKDAISRRLSLELIAHDDIEMFDDDDDTPETDMTLHDRIQCVVQSLADVLEVDLTITVDCTSYLKRTFYSFLELPATAKLSKLSIDVDFELSYSDDAGAARHIALDLRALDIRHLITQMAEALPLLRDVAIFVPCNSQTEWRIQHLNDHVEVEQRSWREDKGWYDESFSADEWSRRKGGYGPRMIM